MSKKQTKTKTKTQYLTRAEVLVKIINFLKKQEKDNSAIEFGLADPYMDNILTAGPPRNFRHIPHPIRYQVLLDLPAGSF